MNEILPKMGIARSAPTAVVFEADQFGGLGLTHLPALQGHPILQYLRGHLRCGDTTGHLMQTLLEYTQLECCGNPLAQEYDKYSALLINTKWITEVWENLHTCKATVKVNGLWQPEVNRQYDTVIMEALVT
jgi:hypothetical protein